MKTKKEKKNANAAGITAADIKGCRDSLLYGLRSTGNGIEVLLIDDFEDMVVHDPEYRAMIVEMLKSMCAQIGYDERCAEVASMARDKMAKALAASNDWSMEDAFKKPVNLNKIPPMGKINIDYVNQLAPTWEGDLAEH